MELKYKTTRHLNFNMHGAFGYTTLNWFKVLFINNFKVRIWGVPKLLWITSSILSTNIFRVYESLRYDKKIRKVNVQAPIFILGYSRSGTTFLHYLVCNDPQFSFCATYQVLMPNVFLSFGLSLQKMLDSFIPKVRIMDNLKMGTKLPKEEEFAMSAISDASMINGFYFPKNIRKYFDKYVLFNGDVANEEEWKNKISFFLKKVTFGQTNKRLVIKSPFNTGRIKQILDLYPEAKFIHIHRDPYEVYYSNEKLFEAIIPAFGFHKVSNAEMENFIFDSYRLTYEKFLKEMTLIPKGNIATIGYEKFVENPVPVLRTVYNDLSILGFENAVPFMEKELEGYKGYVKNSHSVNKEKDSRIYQEWKSIFDAFGYKAKA